MRSRTIHVNLTGIVDVHGRLPRAGRSAPLRALLRDPDDPEDACRTRRAGFSARLVQRFTPDARRGRTGAPSRARRAGRSDGWVARARARSMRWVAESIAEQRLLWNLRAQDRRVLLLSRRHPGDRRGRGILRDQLERDFDKHRFWLAIDSVLMAVLARPLIAVPGPELRRLLLRLPHRRPLLLGPRRPPRAGRHRLDVRAERAADRAARAIALDPRRGNRASQRVASTFVSTTCRASSSAPRMLTALKLQRSCRAPRLPARGRRRHRDHARRRHRGRRARRPHVLRQPQVRGGAPRDARSAR